MIFWRSIAEAILSLQRFAIIHIIHQVEIAHFIVICGPIRMIMKINKRNVNTRCLRNSLFINGLLCIYPMNVVRLRLLSIVQRAAIMSPNTIGSVLLTG